jgi:hypothetical protein
MNCARSNVYYALQNIGIIHNNLNAADIGLDAARESLAMTQESIGISHESFDIFKGCFHIGDGSRGYGCESLYSGEILLTSSSRLSIAASASWDTRTVRGMNSIVF